MKKLLALVLSLAMLFALAACGNTASDNGTSNNSNAGDTNDGGSGIAASDIKIGLICVHDENSGYDLAHIDGLKTACSELGIDESQITMKINIAEQEPCYDAAIQLVEAGCDIIFSDSYGHQSYMALAAQENPDVIFVACTGDQAGVAGIDNLKNIFPYTYESRYVSGVVAGMKLKEMMDNGEVTDPYIGYVGAYPYAEVVCGYTAFLLGIQSVVPEAHMDVQYTNSWYDLNAEAEAANALMARGCVIIGQHADSTGAPSAVEAARKNGTNAYSVGYNIDMLSVAPEAALTSAQNNWSVLYKATLQHMLDGTEIPADYACGYADGAVMISTLGDSCAEGTQEAVDAAWAGIADGSLKVFDTSKFTVDGAPVESHTFNSSIIDFTTGNTIYEGQDYETIVDGAFQESVFRAAPYFDIRIDGITELNPS